VITVVDAPSQFISFFTPHTLLSDSFLQVPATRHQNATMSMYSFTAFEYKSHVCPGGLIYYFTHIRRQFWLSQIFFEFYQNNSMIKSARNVNHFFVMYSRDLFRQFLIFCISVPKLTMVTSPKSVNMTVLTESYRMVTSASNLHNIHSFWNVRCSHLLLLRWRHIWVGKWDSGWIIYSWRNGWLILVCAQWLLGLSRVNHRDS
jgi:hypothetical protein